MDSIVELSRVSKHYGGITALENVSVDIQKGEKLALLGPNGSGKTTLLRLLAFIETPTAGKILFKGKQVTANNAGKMRLDSTMVFQKSVLFKGTVLQNVSYGLRMRKKQKKEIDKEVANALRMVQLEGYEERAARKLSGGEQQRVALARAIVLKTELLLLDEPTANLDPKNASIIEEVINTLNRDNGTTIAMATHNMFQARSLPTRIALIDQGRIGKTGTPNHVFGTLSRALVGFSAIENVFRGNAEPGEKGTTIIDIGDGLQIESASRAKGFVSVYVNPEDIILSRMPISSSARNMLKGRVAEISGSDSTVRLKIGAGKMLVTQITKRSFEEMGLNLDAEVYLTFKASNVQIL